jgi:hypothetical protein
MPFSTGNTLAQADLHENFSNHANQQPIFNSAKVQDTPASWWVDRQLISAVSFQAFTAHSSCFYVYTTS